MVQIREHIIQGWAVCPFSLAERSFGLHWRLLNDAGAVWLLLKGKKSKKLQLKCGENGFRQWEGGESCIKDGKGSSEWKQKDGDGIRGECRQNGLGKQESAKKHFSSKGCSLDCCSQLGQAWLACSSPFPCRSCHLWCELNCRSFPSPHL